MERVRRGKSSHAIEGQRRRASLSRRIVVIVWALLLLTSLPPSLAPAAAQVSTINGIVNPGFENPGQAWEGFFVYGGGVANASDSSGWHTGSRAARLYAPVSGQYGGVCDEAADAVRASIREPISVTVAAADIVNSPASFSARWYVLPDGESVYSVRAGIWLDGYRVEYNYGISGLQNTSTVLSYNLGPVPVGQWFETRRNLYTDLVPLKLPSTVRILYVWFAAFGDCVSRGEIAWVDNARLFYYGDTYVAPQAQITPSVSSGAAPLTVEFNALPGAYVESYSWVSDDGVRGSGLTWTHTFSSVGEHSVTLTVQDSNGEIGIHIQRVSVTPGHLANALQSLPIFLASGGFLSFAIILVLFKRRLGRKFQD